MSQDLQTANNGGLEVWKSISAMPKRNRFNTPAGAMSLGTSPFKSRQSLADAIA